MTGIVMGSESGMAEQRLEYVMHSISQDLAGYGHIYGFDLNNSPLEVWKKGPEFLILTLNPASRDSNGDIIDSVPGSLWPRINEYFNEDNNFNIKSKVQAICYELSRIVNPESVGMEPYEAAKAFAANNAVIARLVPFRTACQKQITKAMKRLSLQVWKRILAVWQPRQILALGRFAADSFQRLLEEKYPSGMLLSTGNHRALYKAYEFGSDTVNIRLLHLPHPSARFNTGLPRNFPEDAHKDSPCREFFEDVFRDLKPRI